MDADIEALVLSGALFNGPARSSSPARSASTSSEPNSDNDEGWHDEELTFANNSHRQQSEEPKESIGMGTGRTGVKGVIRDRDEANEKAKSRRAEEIAELNMKMEKSHLGGRTYLEEEREKLARGEDPEKVDPLALHKTDMLGRRRETKFGHLREVGLKGFVPAVEDEERGVWVVVHIYEPTLQRCYHLDETLARLARTYHETKFVRARASVLGFASIKTPQRPLRGIDEEAEEDDEEDDADDVEVDTDMLPTMLVYRDGELVHNWVRVDWEAGNTGVEDLLERHKILPRKSFFDRDDEIDQDEEDLVWSDEE